MSQKRKARSDKSKEAPHPVQPPLKPEPDTPADQPTPQEVTPAPERFDRSDWEYVIASGGLSLALDDIASEARSNMPDHKEMGRKPSECERETVFAPHESPKRQPDGDPGKGPRPGLGRGDAQTGEENTEGETADKRG